MNRSHAPRTGDDREWISELVDGQAGPDLLARGCEAWAADAELRRTVYTYHLIGDVLRSDDLAGRPAADAAFLSALRARLAGEPVVLAPGPATAAMPVRSHRPLWVVPVALAAGVVAVAGVLVALEPEVAGGLPGPGPKGLGGAGQARPELVRLDDSTMLRNAQVDEYLRAHRETLAGAPPALPGGALRSVELQLSPPQR
jgi:sigma-E factor negative regulatory protein RseA